MKQYKKPDLPEKLEQVRRDLEAWREKRCKGERIPERLWTAAARVVGECGLSRVSGTLRLDYNQLKRRSELGKQAPEVRREPAALFAELAEPPLSVETVCVVELEKGNGTRMRICLTEPAIVDWGRLTEVFLKA